MGLRTASTTSDRNRNRNRWSRGGGCDGRARDAERASRASVARRMIACVLATLLLAASASAGVYNDQGKPYKPEDAGHPLRIAAYVLHPVGVILDRLILRPAAWLGRKEPIKTLVGNTD